MIVGKGHACSPPPSPRRLPAYRVRAQELYDHRGDDGTDFNAWENVNLANETAFAPTVARLRAALAAQFSRESHAHLK